MPRQQADNRPPDSHRDAKTNRGKPKQRKPKQASKLSTNSIIVVGVLALVAVGALVLFTGTLFGMGSSVPATASMDTSKGPIDAKVQIEEFADFQCPACGTFGLGTMRQVTNEYVDTGKVRVTFRHFAFLGNGGANDESVLAGQASECAAEQSKFWAYHDKLLSSQAGVNRGTFSRANLKRFARDLGLDTKAFDTCLDSNKYLSKVLQDTEEGRKKGVTATPTSFVNGQMVKGAAAFAEMKRIIEAELAK